MKFLDKPPTFLPFSSRLQGSLFIFLPLHDVLHQTCFKVEVIHKFFSFFLFIFFLSICDHSVLWYFKNE